MTRHKRIEAWAVVNSRPYWNGAGTMIDEMYRQHPSLNQEDVAKGRRVVRLTEAPSDAVARALIDLQSAIDLRSARAKMKVRRG